MSGDRACRNVTIAGFISPAPIRVDQHRKPGTTKFRNLVAEIGMVKTECGVAGAATIEKAA